MNKYDQGRAELKRRAAARRLAEQRMNALGVTAGVLMLAVIAGVALFSIAGCAGPLVEKGPLTQVGDHATLRGLVRVAQMGEDCSSEQEALKQTLTGVFVSTGLPAPSIVEVRLLAGSSYCGFAQGTANEMGTLELGARNTAVAEATVYWSYIVAEDLRKAQAVLAAMRPLAPRKLGAKLR